MSGGPKIRCLTCGAVIQSTRRHHLAECPCGQVFVDGGSDYMRMGVKPGAEWEFVAP